jgi:hypothetical protein
MDQGIMGAAQPTGKGDIPTEFYGRLRPLLQLAESAPISAELRENPEYMLARAQEEHYNQKIADLIAKGDSEAKIADKVAADMAVRQAAAARAQKMERETTPWVTAKKEQPRRSIVRSISWTQR